MASNEPAGGGTSDGRSSVPSLPPPCPKSPPKYPDLYGKRRGLAKVQMLEREIGFLEEELKSTQGLQPSSRCCKEFTDFVAANPDPFIPTNRKNRRRSCRFWKWLRGIPCFNFSWICCCCYSGCALGQDPSNCCACNPCNCCSGDGCPAPNCRRCLSCSCPKSDCCSKLSCSGCCTCQCPSWKDCCCCRVTFICPKCPKIRCFQCKETCCTGCCLFF